MAAVGLVAATPKFILDLGANTYKNIRTPVPNVLYEEADYEEVLIYTGPPFDLQSSIMMKNLAKKHTCYGPILYPRRFTAGANGELTEVMPFVQRPV